MAKQVSAGGVVYKLSAGQVKIKLILTNKNRWGLPKGHLEAKDANIEVAALREVKEEAGVDTKIEKELGYVEWDLRNGDTKRVYAFLMSLVKDGEVNDPDKEILRAEWKTIPQALGLVEFPPLRKLLIAGIRALDKNYAAKCANCLIRNELTQELCLECLVAAKNELEKRNLKDYKKRSGGK